jgi:hypothetical protein
VLRPELNGDQVGPLAKGAGRADTAVTERKLAHAASSSSDDLRASSANHIQSYISTHYNVRAMQHGGRPCHIRRSVGSTHATRHVLAVLASFHVSLHCIQRAAGRLSVVHAHRSATMWCCGWSSFGTAR